MSRAGKHGEVRALNRRGNPDETGAQVTPEGSVQCSLRRALGVLYLHSSGVTGSAELSNQSRLQGHGSTSPTRTADGIPHRAPERLAVGCERAGGGGARLSLPPRTPGVPARGGSHRPRPRRPRLTIRVERVGQTFRETAPENMLR